MPHFPFAEIRIFDPSETRVTLEDRLENHLRRLRGYPDIDDAKADEAFANLAAKHRPDASSTFQDSKKIQRRVSRLLDRRNAASGLSHLKREDRERIEVLKHGVQLVCIPTEHRADEIAAALHAEAPWMAPAAEVVWQAMRRSVREGWPGVRLPPLLLDGPPGIGKSHWARRLGVLLALPTTVVEATSESASFGLVGSQRGWGSAHPGRLIETILDSLIANPILVIDEVEKAGTVTSTKGTAFSLAESLLPLLEPLTARRWNCPYFNIRFDMSWVNWVLTSNDYRRLPEPLLSRCPPIRLRNLTSEELAGFIRREGPQRQLSQLAVETILDALAHPSLRRRRPSLRLASRMLQRAADLENTPPLQ
ncbi:AAA family ATPase [Paracoccus aminophilus]|uniref:ATP-dependent Lon protease n=1 Tax=Paracoccus aminophilus JCM 7686 TaxID=1367847 RepID=S5XJN8_PARAH|nr:AAA family ATPase [Paracoccus aminophilus]AGT07404.1 ATP-dependent Lon protease [Paracoccus aminophilus JCM 7686]